MPTNRPARQLIPHIYSATPDPDHLLRLRFSFIEADIPQASINIQLRQGLVVAVQDLLSRTWGVSAFQLRSTLRYAASR
jgi:hypothetical protein